MTFDRETGDLLSTDTFAGTSPARQVRGLIVPIHRGEILGLPGMTIAAVSAMGALMMVYTGFALAWRRLVRPILKREKFPLPINSTAKLVDSDTQSQQIAGN